jgi:hypothetical protein
MDVLKIRSENATLDQWKLIGQFSYPTNIDRHAHTTGTSISKETIDYIAGCIRQSEAYFHSAEQAPLDISPLLLYYGSTNLLSGTLALRMGSKPSILHHGMSFHLPSTPGAKIADCEVKPIRPTDGALQIFADVFAPGLVLTNGEAWRLEEIFGSIPDLMPEYENCYQPALPFCIPVRTVKATMHDLDFFYDEVEMSFLEKYTDHYGTLMSVARHKEAYLTPKYNIPSKHVKLYYRKEKTDVGIYSIFGQKYLPLLHTKGKKQVCPSQLLLLCMGLFVLGYLSRYHPERWNPFVRSDDTGERLVIEKFMSICARYFPNLVLNEIKRKRVQFIHEVDVPHIRAED